MVSEVKVTSNHLITPKQALPITHLASALINPHVPSFHIQGGKRGNAEEVWERLAASRRSQGANIFKEKLLGATKGKSRRGGLHPRQLPITKKKAQVLAEEEEEVARRDMSIDDSDFLQ